MRDTWCSFIAVLYVALAVGGNGWIGPTPDPRPQQNFESFVSSKTAQYELYAPSEKELNLAREEVDYAAEQFRLYFGEDPPRIAVVVFGSPEAIQGFDFEPLRKKGLALLPWVSSEYIQKGGANIAALKDLGVVLRQGGPAEGVNVLALLPTGLPAGVDLRVGDSVVALNGKVPGSLQELEENYKRILAGSPVELRIRRGAGEVNLSFVKPEAKGPKVQVQQPRDSSGTSAAPLRRSEARPLSHEAGHVFFVAYVNAKLGPTSPARGERAAHYGHELIPDWFDEAVATLCEFPALQQSRRETMRKMLEKRIPLGELFVMEHPVASSLRDLVRQSREQQAPAGTKVQVVTGGENLLSDPERAIVFYAESLTLAQFLAEKEGAGFIQQIAAALMKGKPMAEALRGAKFVPSDLGELEKTWVEWVKK